MSFPAAKSISEIPIIPHAELIQKSVYFVNRITAVERRNNALEQTCMKLREQLRKAEDRARTSV